MKFRILSLLTLLLIPDLHAAQFTRIAMMGDSITGQTGAGTSYDRNGLWTNLASRLNQQLDIVYNGALPFFATGGKDTVFIRATHLPQVLASNAEACILLAGTNDYYVGRTPADTAANLADMCHTLADHGIVPVLCDVLPVPPGQVGPAGQPLERPVWLAQLHSAVTAVCAADPRIIYLNWFNVLDPDGDGTADQLYFVDSTHPNPNGMSRLGAYAATLLQPYIRPRDIYAGIVWVTPNPEMSGSGPVPDGWAYDSTSSSTVQSSVIPRTDGHGNWWQLAIASTLPADNVFLRYGFGDVGSNWTAGDAIEMVVEFQTDADISPAWNLRPVMFFQPSSRSTTDSQVGLTGTDMPRVATGILRTPAMIIPQGNASLWCDFQLTGYGTVRIGRVGMRKVAPSFATWIIASPAADKSPGGDPDGDGVPNQLEWLLGGNPAVSDAAAQQAFLADGQTLSFRKNVRSEGDSDLIVERSNDLQTWEELPVDGSAASPVKQDPADPSHWTVTGATSPAFFRLKAAWKK